MKTHTTLSIALVGFMAVPMGCRPDRASDNPDVAADYKGSNYEEDIVTGRESRNYKDQGKGIAPKTLRSIEDTITSVYERDFERCLEGQMDEHETRFMRAVFTVEFTIEPSGKTKDPNVLKVGVSKQNAKGANTGEVDSGGMKSCIEQSILSWEFEPPPEVVYRHTYNGQVGEAF